MLGWAIAVDYNKRAVAPKSLKLGCDFFLTPCLSVDQNLLVWGWVVSFLGGWLFWSLCGCGGFNSAIRQLED